MMKPRCTRIPKLMLLPSVSTLRGRAAVAATAFAMGLAVVLAPPAAGRAAPSTPPVGAAPANAAAVDIDRLVREARVFPVEQGDSWFSVRSKVCPVEALQAANPELAERTLREGDRITAPFVDIAKLELVATRLATAERAVAETRLDAERRAAEARTAIVTLESRVAELGSIQAERDDAVSARSAARSIMWVAIGIVVILVVGIALASARMLEMYREHVARARQVEQIETQYTELRRGLNDLDLQLQRRMLQLVSWHDTRGLTDRQVEDAAAPVLDLARKLRERHAG